MFREAFLSLGGGWETRVCPYCGFRTDDEASFCVNCSSRLPEIKPNSIALPLRDIRTVALLAGLVGVVFMGLGHFYIFQIKRGLVYLCLGILTGIVFVVAALGGFFAASVEIAAVVGSLRVALWAWQTIEAYYLGRAYNKSLKDRVTL